VPRRRAPRSKTSAKVRKSMALAATAAVRAAAGQELAQADGEGGPILRGNRRYWAIPGQPVDLSEQVGDCSPCISRACLHVTAFLYYSLAYLVAVLMSPLRGYVHWRSLRLASSDGCRLVLRLTPIVMAAFGSSIINKVHLKTWSLSSTGPALGYPALTTDMLVFW
jgi:hypothetical protein